MKINRAQNEIFYFGFGIAGLLIFGSFSESIIFSFRSRFILSIGLTALVFMIAGIFIGFRYITVNNRNSNRKHSLKNEAPYRKLNEISFKPNELDELSDRENEVLNLLSEGMTNAGILEKLFISLNTTKSQLQKFFSKLGVKNGTQVLLKAQSLKIVS